MTHYYSRSDRGVPSLSLSEQALSCHQWTKSSWHFEHHPTLSYYLFMKHKEGIQKGVFLAGSIKYPAVIIRSVFTLMMMPSRTKKKHVTTSIIYSICGLEGTYDKKTRYTRVYDRITPNLEPSLKVECVD